MFFIFCGWFDVFWCSCGFGELAAIGCCTIEDSREKLKTDINYVCVIDDCPTKSLGSPSYLLLSHHEWVLLGVKEEKTYWDLINDSSDSMGGGRRGTESSSVCGGCSLETTNIGELSL